MITESIVLNEERKVTLTTYLLANGGELENIVRRPAVVVIPGGGYGYCSDREAEPIALHYLRAGFDTFVLRYSVKPYSVWPQPLRDFEQAMRMIRSHADEWGIYPDKIAAVGFSAGAHLTAAGATMSADDCRPNAAILVYPVLNKASVQEWEPTAPGTIEAVDERTPPCFLACSRTDTAVTAQNTMDFTQALFNADISFESHIYSYALHGFGTGDLTDNTPEGMGTMSERLRNWMPDSVSWLREIFGEFGEGAMTEPKIGHYAIRSHEEMLSSETTVGQILDNTSGKEYLERIIKELRTQGKIDEQIFALPQSLIERQPLSFIFRKGQVPEDAQKEIDEGLRQIPRVL